MPIKFLKLIVTTLNQIERSKNWEDWRDNFSKRVNEFVLFNIVRVYLLKQMPDDLLAEVKQSQ